MNPTMLILLPPLALLTWRGDWPSAAALLGSVLLVAYLDWSARKTDWNGSVAVDLDHANHAIKTLRGEIEKAGVASAQALDLMSQNLVKLAAEVKRLGEVAEGHSRALQQTGKPRSIL
jgi:hypothetical protein